MQRIEDDAGGAGEAQDVGYLLLLEDNVRGLAIADRANLMSELELEDALEDEVLVVELLLAALL